MYAIVRDGSMQLRVEEGDTVRLAYRDGVEPGDELALPEVLLVGDGDGVQVGKPLVEGAAVRARVTRHLKDRKIVVYKYKRRKTNEKKQGHRQPYTEAVVEAIEVPGA
jgi:large subunit ribosomal protein L21